MEFRRSICFSLTLLYLFHLTMSLTGFKKDNCLTRMIKNNKKQFLVLDEEGLRFEDRNNNERKKEECLFNICCYKNTKHIPIGVTVTLSHQGQNKIICCCDHTNGKVCELRAIRQDLPLPTFLEPETVFDLQRMKEGRELFRIESSMWSNYFLGCEDAEQGLVKLVLKKAGEDVVEGLELVDVKPNLPIT